MYDYLFGWEEYLRRTKERKASIVFKKAPEEPFAFKPGRTRQRPHRFLKPNLPLEELGWRQLLGGSESKTTAIDSAKELMGCLAVARARKQAKNSLHSGERVLQTSLGGTWESLGQQSYGQSAKMGRLDSPADLRALHSAVGRRSPWDPEMLKEKEIRLFELSQTQHNLVRRPHALRSRGQSGAAGL